MLCPWLDDRHAYQVLDMDDVLPLIFAVSIGSAILFFIVRHLIRYRRLSFIENYSLNSALKARLVKKYPHLNDKDTAMALMGLRDYYRICAIANGRMVSMPSQVVDVLWHEMILFTKEYERFCRRAFGRFLHHTPAEAMSSKTQAQDGIKRAWKFACAKESIDPKAPSKLPLLFALDQMLAIEDGFFYSLNCTGLADGEKQRFCATNIGCGGGCASTGCGGGSCAGGSDGGGGCGGGGCGGD